MICDDTYPPQCSQHVIRSFFWSEACRIKINFRIFRFLIKRIIPGKILDLAAACFFVQSFWIALLSNAERSIDEDLNEFILADYASSHPALGAERRNESR